MRVKYLAQEHNAVPRPGLEPGPSDPESSALTTRENTILKTTDVIELKPFKTIYIHDALKPLQDKNSGPCDLGFKSFDEVTLGRGRFSDRFGTRTPPVRTSHL